MDSIRVDNLCKVFESKRKAAGLRASLRAVVRPRFETVEAVAGISFAMGPGELLGFIGPNGAGKSTTIKMLTGILHPTSGQATVLGFVPWRQRRDLAYHIGTVFGQRPQLWYHLPAIDTFLLFGKVYEVDDRVIKRRVAYLAEAFEIEHLLETPVRKLSLGQRMRCEVAASLLHQPQLLLLDEPSIGLDVVAKQRIRDTIRRMNEEEGVGVLLTSHDAGDLEALCKRVIIVNHGRIVYEDKVSALKRRFLTSKQVDVRYADELDPAYGVAGAEVVKLGRYGAKLRFDTSDTAVADIVARVAEAGDLVDVTISDPSLEDVIRTIYEQVGQRATEPGGQAAPEGPPASRVADDSLAGQPGEDGGPAATGVNAP